MRNVSDKSCRENQNTHTTFSNFYIIIIIITIISFRKYVSTIPGNHDVRELQKTAILGTAHILRKVIRN
jgi:hypothetical protein